MPTDERITIDPKVMLGKPCIAGTRITVELVLEKLAGGESIDQICRAHPHVTPDDVRAAVRYAADVLKGDMVFPHRAA